MKVEKRPPTLGQIRRGEVKLTKRQIVALEKDSKSIASYASGMSSIFDLADALAQATGEPYREDEDLPTYVARVRHHQSAAAPLRLYESLLAALENTRRQQGETSRAASASASKTRVKGVTPIQARQFVEEFEAKNHTRRGAVTAGAIEYNIDPRTFSNLLST